MIHAVVFNEAVILTATHLACAFIGGLIVFRMVLKHGDDWVQKLARRLSKEPPVQQPPPDDGVQPEPPAPPDRNERGERESNKWVIILVIAGIFVAMIGGFAWVDNRQSDHERATAKRNDAKLARAVQVSDDQRECLAEWAKELTDTIVTRSEGTAELRAAEKRKDEADDAVTGVFVEGFITQPKPPMNVLKDHFAKALREFVAARKHLAHVRATLEDTVVENPYPILDLNCTPTKDATP